jgi:CubicO group peptidase (beta-lactamase class C family)
MQNHAVLMGLGALDNDGLARELRSQLGRDVALRYSQPQPAGGVVTSAADYARVLRKLLTGELALGAQLGQHAVCTNRLRCPGQALHTPVPLVEAWHYGLGYWIEDDPVFGDGTFSSAGAFGFYPWINAAVQGYGVIARKGAMGSGHDSVLCGRLLRKAWADGQPR